VRRKRKAGAKNGEQGSKLSDTPRKDPSVQCNPRSILCDTMSSADYRQDRHSENVR
jgi:hypothetical protein